MTNKNKTLFESVLAMLSKDPNLSEEERKSFGAAYATSTNRKYSIDLSLFRGIIGICISQIT